MDNPIPINLPDMQSRVEHGYHLTNEEARWLLSQIGVEVPRNKRCPTCNGTGRESIPQMCHTQPCVRCNASGYVAVREPSYQVIGQPEVE